MEYFLGENADMPTSVSSSSTYITKQSSTTANCHLYDFTKFGRVVSEIWMRTDRETDRQTDKQAHRSIIG